MAPSRFSSLRFTSVGVFTDLLRILIGNSSRTVTFSCSAPALPCHRCIRYPCSSGSCMLWSKIRPFARPFSDSLRNPPSFNSSSDLRIFKLDGVPLGRDIPNNLRSSSLSSSKFDNCCSVCSKHRNMPSLPSYGTGSYPIVPFSDFIRYGIVFGHCSHIVQTSS